MIEHFEELKHQDGKTNVRLPNNIFRCLSTNIKNKSGSINIQQVAFSYVYLITNALLYKYAHFVSIDNGTYIQNSDIKELLGYNRGTKSIDKVIKKNGILDELGLTLTTKEYPIYYTINPQEKINDIPLREFTTINERSDVNDINYSKIKKIVKNRNYEIKEPLFITKEFEDSEYGTLYNIERTHEITIKEFITFISDNELNNIDFLIYGYLKSRCKGYRGNLKAIALYKMVCEIGIDRSAFYDHLELLKKKKYIAVNHKEWKMKGEKYKDMESNEYIWLGVENDSQL
jgi:hypothetical protein